MKLVMSVSRTTSYWSAEEKLDFIKEILQRRLSPIVTLVMIAAVIFAPQLLPPSVKAPPR